LYRKGLVYYYENLYKSAIWAFDESISTLKKRKSTFGFEREVKYFIQILEKHDISENKLKTEKLEAYI